ncbi:hypothetical protein IAT38_000661 [Cryptococcus sp. DSM 104549]
MLFGLFGSSPSSSSDKPNSIPPPRSDAHVNAPPPELHRTVADFVHESPSARYVFDSRRNGDQEDTELCRIRPDGGVSCIKVALASAALFKSMQSLGFYCALPAEPTRTHMECNRIPR